MFIFQVFVRFCVIAARQKQAHTMSATRTHEHKNNVIWMQTVARLQYTTTKG